LTQVVDGFGAKDVVDALQESSLKIFRDVEHSTSRQASSSALARPLYRSIGV
jgi:hypothetical protein